MNVTRGLFQVVFFDILALKDRLQTFSRSFFQHFGIVARNDTQSPLAMRKVIVTQTLRLIEDGLSAVVEHWEGTKAIVLH